MKKKMVLLAALAVIALSGCKNDSSSESFTHLDEPSVVFHYQRGDNNYEDWNLWLWGFGYEGARYDFNGTDRYGVYAHYPLSNWVGSEQVGFIVRKTTANDEWAAKDPSPDRFVNLNEWEPNEYDEYHIYLRTGELNVFTDNAGTIYNGLANAYFMNKDLLFIKTTTPPYKVEILANDEVVLTFDEAKINSKSSFTIPTSSLTIDFNTVYRVRVSFTENDPIPRLGSVLMHRLYTADEFATAYNYDGELGAIYTPQETTFKVWAPTSSSMVLRIYNNGTPTNLDSTRGNDDFTPYAMSKGDKGVFFKTVTGDLHGKYYTYVVTNTNGINEVVDPYAKAAGINGARGLIVDFSKTNPAGWTTVNNTNTYASNVDASIYELHVRDLTMDSTWQGTEANRGTYKGMWQSGTTYTKGGVTVKTGFDHIKELGVNAVHILPMFDHANDERKPYFNWGYNPLNYNVLEGSYSSDPYNGLTRILEAKEMIKAYDQAGIKIVMDVVYNHVADANGSNFHKLVPGYYFRYTEDGAHSSGSGCGNDTASERYMFEKFMVDSTAFLAEEYKLGGFRFDLMGLHTTDSMNAVRNKLITIDPDILVYGEPWKLGTTLYGTPQLANHTNLNKIAGIAAFSDQIRDAVRGGVFDAAQGGWVQATTPNSALATSLSGSTKGALNATVNPLQRINYVSAHDNNTLFDKLLSSGVTKAKAPQVATQSSAIVTFAQGVPFYHAGDELMRQKINPDGSFNHNSYNASDELNSIKWDQKVTYLDNFNKYKEMITLREAHPLFKNVTAANITANYTALTAFGGLTLTNSTIGYKLVRGIGMDADSWQEAIIIHNGNNSVATINATGYSLGFVSNGTLAISASMAIPTNTSVVLYK